MIQTSALADATDRSFAQRFACRVPWKVDRTQAPVFVLTNTGDARLGGVSLSLLGSGVMPASAPTSVDPGGQLAVTILADDLARATVLVVRWFQPDGEEYLWRVSF